MHSTLWKFTPHGFILGLNKQYLVKAQLREAFIRIFMVVRQDFVQRRTVRTIHFLLVFSGLARILPHKYEKDRGISKWKSIKPASKQVKTEKPKR